MKDFFFFRRGFFAAIPSGENVSSPVMAGDFNGFFPEDPDAASATPPGGANKETI